MESNEEEESVLYTSVLGPTKVIQGGLAGEWNSYRGGRGRTAYNPTCLVNDGLPRRIAQPLVQGLCVCVCVCVWRKTFSSTEREGARISVVISQTFLVKVFSLRFMDSSDAMGLSSGFRCTISSSAINALSASDHEEEKTS